MQNTKNLSNIGEVKYFVEYSDGSKIDENEQHIHAEYEIYVNISGAVSFVCGENIYPVNKGNIIINRPGEPHHCVYHKKIPHKHYWILFTCDKSEPLLDIFLNRELGVGNLITLSERDATSFFKICKTLASNEDKGDFSSAYNFIKLLMILNSGDVGKESVIPSEITDVLTYISHNISKPISVKQMAESVHMSLSSFERCFKSYIGMSPKRYITQRRLALSSEMLTNGYNVTETCEACGFADYSHFISIFRQHFGLTPLQFQKKHKSASTLD